MKLIRVPLALFGLVPIVGACADKKEIAQTADAAEIATVASAADLQSEMGHSGVTVIHALDAEHYGKGHVPGAVNVDYETMAAGDLPADKSARLIFYCASPGCPVSHMAANKAASYGYTNVAVYPGGIQDWRASGMDVASGSN